MAKSTRSIVDHVIGHKGAGFSYPENTLDSFNQAAKMGLVRTEFDVRLTKDGIAVLSNQDSLLKTSGIDKKISESTYAEIKDINVNSYHDGAVGHASLPLLEDALTLITKLKLTPQIELKAHDSNWQSLAQEASRIIDEHYGYNEDIPQPLVTSFSPECLALFSKSAHGEYNTGLLIHSEATGEWKETVSEHDFDYIHIFSKHISEELAQEVRSAGFGLNAYKVMDKETAETLIKNGVGGFTTDEPETFIHEAEP